MRTLLLLVWLVCTAGMVVHAEVTVNEGAGLVTLQNESVRVSFNPAVNYVPCALINKRGSGQNLIVDNFCLYYQYVENGNLRSVNEGYPGGQVANGVHRLETNNGAVTLEFSGDTPHFHLRRRVTVPSSGPVVKFVYELECKASDSFGFSLPYAPLLPKLNRVAIPHEVIGRDGVKRRQMIVEDASSPTLHAGAPFDRTECFFDPNTGEGVVFVHVADECSAGISGRSTPRFEAGKREKVAFVLVPFARDYEKALSAYMPPKKVSGAEPSGAASAVVLERGSDWILWGEHATRKVFAEEAPPSSTGKELVVEAAKGESECFQLVLRPARTLPEVKLVFAALTNEMGGALAVSNLTFNPVGSLRSSYGEEIPDLLLQKGSVACPKDQNTVFWVSIKVPLETRAGIYRGTFAMVSGGETLARVNVRLKVWDFALSPTPHICAFATDNLYYHDTPVDLNNEAQVKASWKNSTGEPEEVAGYYTRMKFFAAHRLYETHFGPRPNYSGAMRVNWQEKPDGRWDFADIDFSAFDKAREYCYRELHWPRFAYDPELVPYLAFINQYTFGGKDEKEYWYMRYWDPVLPKKDPKKYLPSIYDLSDDFTPEFKEKFLRYIKTIADHCRARGISIDENGNGPVLFLADEIPDYGSGHAVVRKTLELARLIKQADPRVILVVNGRDVPEDPEILNLFDLWTARAPVETLAKLRKLGKRYGDYYMHSYFDLRAPAINPRIQFWSYWKYDFFWIGDWAMTISPDLRWYGAKRDYGNNWWFPSMQSRYGEPMSTIRFELMREGLEDHEYLWMLRDCVARLKSAPEIAAEVHGAEGLLKRAESAGGNYTGAGGEYYFDGYLQDPVKLLQLRHEIGEALEMLASIASRKNNP